MISIHMYRNITHECSADTNWQSIIHLFSWDDDGNPIQYDCPYMPYLYYVPRNDNETLNVSDTFTTITQKPLIKKEFKNIFERKKWIDNNPNVKIYDCWSPEMAFLRDMFTNTCEKDDFSKYPLKTYAFDIETTVGAKFPDVNNPTEAITCLTVADMKTFESWTWMFLANPWKKKLSKNNFKNNGNRKYFVFNTEHEMFEHFLKWFKNNRPDIITGWNIDSFDIPFIVNRISMVISPDVVAEAFSPLNKMRKVLVKHNLKALPYESYRFEGLSCLDYMILYRDKFCKGSMVTDYKLETVCMEELGVGKLSYDCSFKEFYEGNFERFIDYNIIDVIRICDLEKKLKLISLTRYMCNTSLIQYEKIMASQPIVIGALDILMRQQGQLIMTDDRVDPDSKKYPFEGAYVFSRKEYMSGPFASFDLNSLYPNIIMTLNISPETLIGQIHNFNFDDEDWEVTINGKTKLVKKKDFIKKFENKINIASNGALFMKRKYRVGMCAQFEDKFYKGRKVVKKKMLEKESEAANLLAKILKVDKDFDYENPMVKLDTEDKKNWAKLCDEVSYYSIAQLGMKTNLNSLYGLFSSKFSPICSMPCAAAITKCGQTIIRSSMTFLNKKIEVVNELIRQGKNVIGQNIDWNKTYI